MKKAQKNLPTMLFDGECGFCRRRIGKWSRITGELVQYASYQEAISRYPDLSAQQFAKSVHLILPDGTVFAGAHAVFKTLHLSGRWPSLLRLYESSPLFAYLAEWIYRIVACHRGLLSIFL
jgi:lipase maturation factor 1